MIDRFGCKVNIGWSEHEDLWLEAANTLGMRERREALRDVASLTGRGYYAVSDRARKMRERDRHQAEAATRKRVMRLPPEWALEPSSIPAPSMARKMGAR